MLLSFYFILILSNSAFAFPPLSAEATLAANQLKTGVESIALGNYTDAMKWLLKAAEAGNSEAMCKIAGLYYNGQGMEKPSFDQTKMWLQKAATLGNGVAMADLGSMYLNGKGLARPDTTKALEWYRKAVDHGHSGGIEALEKLKKQGVTQETPNYEHALNYDLEAAKAGNLSAMFQLGYIFSNGIGLTGPDHLKGLKWYQEAANLGYVPAMNNLAFIYERGLGLAMPNLEKAVEWTQKAAEARDRLAMRTLGKFYKYGKGKASEGGIAPNPAMAAYWLRKADEFGATDEALFDLGITEREGTIVAIDNAGDLTARESAQRLNPLSKFANAKQKDRDNKLALERELNELEAQIQIAPQLQTSAISVKIKFIKDEIKRISENNQCAVCGECVLDQGSFVLSDSSMHAFCAPCLQTWFESGHDECPSCRKSHCDQSRIGIMLAPPPESTSNRNTKHVHSGPLEGEQTSDKAAEGNSHSGEFAR